MKRLIAGMLAYALVFGVAYYAQPAFAQIVASGGGLSTVTTSAPLTGSGTVASPVTLPTTANPQVNSLLVTGNITANAACTGASPCVVPSIAGDFAVERSTNTGAIYFGSNQLNYIFFDGTNFYFSFPGAVVLNNNTGINERDSTGNKRNILNLDATNILQLGGIGISSTQLNNPTLSTQGIGTIPTTIALLATCNAANEGLIARQTNSTAACSSGAIATTAGTTHCFVGCNGTNWVQFGF